MSIKIRVRELRRARGLTQVQLAERCGMPQSTISRIESGATRGVEFETLDKIAVALEAHPADLIALDDVTFDHKGRSYTASDVTADARAIPSEAAVVWRIRGTDLTFPTDPGTGPGAVITAARKMLAAVV